MYKQYVQKGYALTPLSNVSFILHGYDGVNCILHAYISVKAGIKGERERNKGKGSKGREIEEPKN